MSNLYEPTIEEMRIELQVLTRAVSILFATHPDPTALRAAWDIVIEDLKPSTIKADASDIEKKRDKIHCAESLLATKLRTQIGRLRDTKGL